MIKFIKYCIVSKSRITGFQWVRRQSHSLSTSESMMTLRCGMLGVDYADAGIVLCNTTENSQSIHLSPTIRSHFQYPSQLTYDYPILHLRYWLALSLTNNAVLGGAASPHSHCIPAHQGHLITRLPLTEPTYPPVHLHIEK